MKKYKSLAALLLGFLLSAALFPMQALAAGSIDLNRDASLTITEKYGETPLSGCALTFIWSPPWMKQES